MVYKFKKGDRVELIEDCSFARKGMKGKVLRIQLTFIDVKFDEKFEGGHSCNGFCEEGYGHSCPSKDLKLIDGKFKVGDRVEVIKDFDGAGLVGKFAIIKNIKSNTFGDIEVDDWEEGHDCGGECREDSGWNIPLDHLKNLSIGKQTKAQKLRIDTKRKQIIKEIKSIKDFAKCFKNITKEVSSWEEDKIEDYELDEKIKKIKKVKK